MTYICTVIILILHDIEPSWPVRISLNTTFANYPQEYRSFYREGLVTQLN